MTNVNSSIDPVSPQNPPIPGDGLVREVVVEGAAAEGPREVEIEKDVEESIDLDIGHDGERRPKPLKRPNAPTKAQIAEQFPCHAHYRSWCPDCRAGRSVGKQHRTQAEDEDGSLGPVISMDYAFEIGEEIEDDLSPVLVAYDHGKKALWTLEVDEKGVEAGIGVEWLHRKLEFA